jgi:hypothetical protein
MNDGRSFEHYVQFVFSSLLNMKDEGVVVGRDVQLVDKLGLPHRVDIFYHLFADWPFLVPHQARRSARLSIVATPACLYYHR